MITKEEGKHIADLVCCLSSASSMMEWADQKGDREMWRRWFDLYRGYKIELSDYLGVDIAGTEVFRDGFEDED
jgi:hypothetical protein